MKSLKEAAPQEVDSIKTRSRKLFAMGRLSQGDCDRVISACDDLEVVIRSVTEPADEERREF